MFLTQVTGYTISAILINKVHMRFGQLGIAIIGPSFKIFTYVVTCLHPPFPVIPIVFALAGFGNGLMDGAWNAWVGGLAHPNELLGLLHGAYGLGATVAPLISTSMVTTGGLKWYTFYYIVVGGAVSELIFATFAFRTATGAKFCLLHPAQLNAKSRTHEALSYKLTWLLSIFLLIYVGTEVSIGGWIVTFMLEIRHGPAFSSGMVATGFWLGLTLGRVILGFITGRIGEKLAITIYLILAVALELVFWLVKSFVTSAVMIAFVGFCLGPVFPAVIVVVTKALPEHLHVSVIGFVAAVGMAGAALIPFATGAIGQATGVGVLGPIALGLIAGILVLWVCLPGGFKDKLDRKVERTPGQQEV
ncbi:hypothetical protein G7Y89_g15037 [Cudoniella acicularis]|uniref:Major facilitator superfamily (MFS) profile domain-containing protein n=1 Tax=Cudoniella acicularis TaxID=354080 RepID=A0A8H4QUW5_9HELO|nr:hypothetical protein G7Y89_g15037 [Cudoniella acicularis]